MRALVVTPDAGLAEELAGFFRGRGLSAGTAASVDEARAAIASEPVVHLLVDLELGAPAIAACREANPAADPWVLVLTGEEGADRLRPAFEAGADDVLALPPSPASLQLRLAIGERALAARRRRRQAERRVEEQEQRYRTLLETLAEGVLHLDADGVIQGANSSLSRITGFSTHELLGERADAVLVDPAILAKLPGGSLFGATTGSEQHTVALRSKDGGSLWVSLAAAPLPPAEPGGRAGALGVLQDVTVQRRTEAALDRERTFFQQLFRNSPAGIVIVDDEEVVVDCNRAFSELFGYEAEETHGRPLSELIVPDGLRDEAGGLSRAVFDRGTVERETVRRRKDGTELEVAVIGYPVILASGRVGAFGLYTDIRERKHAERRLVHDASHDPLTHLPNRARLTAALEAVVHRPRRGDEIFAVLFLDLDGFKGINDRLGHAAGDAVLVETARRLERSLRPGDLVARLGGDEFAVVLDGLGSREGALAVAGRVLEALGEPHRLGDEEVVSAGSVGVAFGGDGADAEAMLRDADRAMYEAKRQGKGRIAVFGAA